MKRAILYARTSGDDKQNATSSLDGQLALGRDYAAKRGWHIVAELAEDERGISGSRLDAPMLQRALNMAYAGEYDVLVVRELDRLARNLAKQLLVESELRAAGVDIEYILGEYPDTPEGQLNKHIRAVIAEYEREKIAERSIRGRVAKVRSGRIHTHGNTPYGYIEIDGKLEIDPETAEVVRRIFQLYLQGHKAHAIALMLAEAGIRPPSYKRHKNTTWRGKTVSLILSNRTYIGEWRYGKKSGNPIYEQLPPICVPAIVDHATFEAAQRLKTRNRQLAQRNKKYDYLLSGMVKCGKCGYSVSGYSAGRKTNQQQGRYYICYHKSLKQCDGVGYWRANDTENEVWTWVQSLLASPAHIRAKIEELQCQERQGLQPVIDDLSAVNKRLVKAEKDLDAILDLYLAGDFTREQLRERKNQLEQTIGAAKQEKAKLQAKINRPQIESNHLEALERYLDTIVLGEVSNYQEKRRILLDLDTKVTFIELNGSRLLDIQCNLGGIMLVAGSSRITGSRTDDIVISDRLKIS